MTADIGDVVAVKRLSRWKKPFVSSERRKHAGKIGLVFFREDGTYSRLPLLTLQFPDGSFGHLFEHELDVSDRDGR